MQCGLTDILMVGGKTAAKQPRRPLGEKVDAAEPLRRARRRWSAVDRPFTGGIE